ncbi:UNVERIFIED_ORG: hypothetical protein J2W19_002651 [Shinella zoogloeoides]|nr:hypothetical protein [Shinella zoogloeoides]
MLVTRWKEPVMIQIGSGTSRVAGPFEAIIHMMENWPRRTDPKFLCASIACKAAVAGRINAEEARRDFLAAAQEADLYRQR